MSEVATDRISAAMSSGATRLDLRGLGLEEFPREIFNLADTLEILDLSGNQFTALPSDFHRLHRLKILFCSENRFTEWPEVLGECASLEMVGFKSNRIESIPENGFPARLRWLILTDNRLSQLPRSIGRCPRLQKLMLAGNHLSSLPDSMARCRNLELIRLAANRFTEFPGWLFELPRLAWLAVAGNPWLEVSHADAMDEISWDALQPGKTLGQGASGVISEAVWDQGGGVSRAVALKVFKGAMTSDGMPAHEMLASLAAGRHPNLIRVLGKVRDHPQGAMAVVLDLVDERFRSLAGPPDFDSCTRDVYREGFRVDRRTALAILADTASVLRHLHQRQIAHGDFYGHNLLHDGAGNCLLGDFGAASFYPEKAGFERIEVRAFGCLMEELLEQVESVVLSELVARCTAEEVASRPGFEEICGVLEGLRAG